MVKPDDAEYAGDEWEGVVNKMTRITAGNIKNLETQFNKKTDKMLNTINDFVQKDVTQEKLMKAHIEKVTKASQDEVSKKITNLERLLTKVLNQGREAGQEDSLGSSRVARADNLYFNAFNTTG